MSTSATVKRSTRQTRIGQAGIDLIAQRVGEMGHHWHATSAAIDTGIDGEIELVDPGTGEVRNFRVGVQSKATEGIWRSETEAGFLYKATPDDVHYWMGSNQPVLLVCSRPSKREAYFRNVQQWGSDRKARATGLIDFDKQRDRFDAAAAARLFSLEARLPILLEPPGPVAAAERAKSNLLPIFWETASVWVVPSPGEMWRDWFPRALDAGVARTDLAMREGKLWSLTPFDDQFLAAIGAGDEPDSMPLATFTQTAHREFTNLVAELVKKTLLSVHHAQLRWSGPGRVAYFKLYPDQPERKFKWGQGPGRTVVKPRPSRQHEGLSGYRHDAAKLYVRRLGGSWVLSVTPTYLFTYDGRQLSSFHAAALKKMKTQDRAAAVSQQLRMWEYLLKERGQIGAERRPFQLGGLLELELPVRPPEQAWVAAPADPRDDDPDLDETDDGAGELTLFDELDAR
jgi:hypothetical protein